MHRAIQEEMGVRKAAILNGVYLEPPTANSSPMAIDHQKLPKDEASPTEESVKEQKTSQQPPQPQQQQKQPQQQQQQQKQPQQRQQPQPSKVIAKTLPRQTTYQLTSSNAKVLVLPSFSNQQQQQQQQQVQRVNSLPSTKTAGGLGPGSSMQCLPVQSQGQQNVAVLQKPRVVTSTVVLGKPLVFQQQQQQQQQQQSKAVVVASSSSMHAVGLNQNKVQDPSPTSSENPNHPNRTEEVGQQQQVEQPSRAADPQVVVSSGQLQGLAANQKIAYVLCNGTLRPLNAEDVRLNPHFKQIYDQQQQQAAANAAAAASRVTLIRTSGASNGTLFFIYSWIHCF